MKNLLHIIILLFSVQSLQTAPLVPTSLQFATGTLTFLGKKLVINPFKRLKRLSLRRKISMQDNTALPRVEKNAVKPADPKTSNIMEISQPELLEIIATMEGFLLQ